MMRNFFLAMALLASAACACAQGPDVGEISRDIDAKGARATVISLDHQQRFDAVLEQVASGDAVWIQLAGRLASGADAEDAIGLTVALAKALPKNPEAVLRVLDNGPVTGTDAVCGVPFIEPTQDEVKTYLEHAIPAVTHVADAVNPSRRSACLASLRHAEKQLDALR
jgi:hypothetical protein